MANSNSKKQFDKTILANIIMLVYGITLLILLIMGIKVLFWLQMLFPVIVIAWGVIYVVTVIKRK